MTKSQIIIARFIAITVYVLLQYDTIMIILYVFNVPYGLYWEINVMIALSLTVIFQACFASRMLHKEYNMLGERRATPYEITNFTPIRYVCLKKAPNWLMIRLALLGIVKARFWVDNSIDVPNAAVIPFEPIGHGYIFEYRDYTFYGSGISSSTNVYWL